RRILSRLNRQHTRATYLAGLCYRRTDNAELGGSNGHGHSAEKATAIMVDFFGHFLPPINFRQAKRGHLSSPLKMLLQAALKKLSDNGSLFLPLDGEGRSSASKLLKSGLHKITSSMIVRNNPNIREKRT